MARATSFLGSACRRDGIIEDELVAVLNASAEYALVLSFGSAIEAISRLDEAITVEDADHPSCGREQALCLEMLNGDAHPRAAHPSIRATNSCVSVRWGDSKRSCAISSQRRACPWRSRRRRSCSAPSRRARITNTYATRQVTYRATR